MSSTTHQIELVFNVEVLQANLGGTIDSPARMPADGVFMISPNKSDRNWGGTELYTNAKNNDRINWHVSTFNSPANQNVMIYAMSLWDIDGDTDTARRKAKDFMDAPSVSTDSGYYKPFPSDEVEVTTVTDPAGYLYKTEVGLKTVVTGNSSYWTSRIKKSEAARVKVAYSFRVVLFNDGDQPIGYFTWDPFVMILPS